jgi:hypothetical protein
LTPSTATILEENFSAHLDELHRSQEQICEAFELSSKQSFLFEANIALNINGMAPGTHSLPGSRRNSLIPPEGSPILGRPPRGMSQTATPTLDSPSSTRRQRQRAISLPYTLEPPAEPKPRSSDLGLEISFLNLLDSDLFSESSIDNSQTLLPSCDSGTPIDNSPTPTATVPALQTFAATATTTRPLFGPNLVKIIICDECHQRSIGKYNPDVIKWHRFEGCSQSGLCGVCGGNINTESLELSTANKYRFLCKLCSLEFNRADRLLAHSHLHSGIKAFPCLECSACFSRKSKLSTHMTESHASTAKSSRKAKSTP